MIALKSLFVKCTLVLLFLFPAVYVQAQDGKFTRSIRYQPQGEDFVITNGQYKFNRALYGTNTAFRIEAGDLPEFAFYMPGMGGNLKLALVRDDKAIWLSEAKQIEARYRPGSMIYTLTDPIIGEGRLILTALAMDDEEGLILKADFKGLPDHCRLLTLYGGASNEIFRRSGERNVDAPDCFYLKPENCKNNSFVILKNTFSLRYGGKTTFEEGTLEENRVTKQDRMMLGTLPSQSQLILKDAAYANSPLVLMKSSSEVRNPVLFAQTDLSNNQTLYLSFHSPVTRQSISEKELPALFDHAEKTRVTLTSRCLIDSPDPFLNAIGGALSIAGDAIWEEPSYLHGAISWRVRIPGWRAAYVADVLGWNDRAESHFSAYANSQLTAPSSGPVMMDSACNLARAKKQIGSAMYSSGYICPLPNQANLAELSHYDMNLVFIDALVRHFNWTGDVNFLKKIWPVIERHLDWEKRTFDADGDGLYDAYCCIWASDALYYNGGGVTHSSAYNYFINRSAARLATLIGKDPHPYQQEADKILEAVNQKLWMKENGWYAEFADASGYKKLHKSAALWSVYHAIDSWIADPFQEYQTLRYVDTQIPHIPFKISGMDNEKFSVLTTTNWMPYSWSINNVATAEQMHTALAYWQGGRNEEAFKLLKSVVMDVMYCGSSPGNFAMSSIYNAASRNEGYRDFADVIGISSRTLIEGLFGIRPDRMNNRLILKPGFPDAWDHASIKLPYVEFNFRYDDGISKYTILQKGNNTSKIILRIKAKAGQIADLTANGKPCPYQVISGNVGFPMVEIELPAQSGNELAIRWSQEKINTTPAEVEAVKDQMTNLSINSPVLELSDPQKIISEQKIAGKLINLKLKGTPGEKTLFAKVKQGEMTWWQPVHIALKNPVEISAGDPEDNKNLKLSVINHSDQPVSGVLWVGKNSRTPWSRPLKIAPNTGSPEISVPAGAAVAGTNPVEFRLNNGNIITNQLINWALPVNSDARFESVDLTRFFNDKVTQLFNNKYLSPRSPYNTLQIPVQGIGDWCKPLHTVALSDSGFRVAAVDNSFHTPLRINFSTPQAADKPNIVFTSLWDNYPDSVSIPLTGRASHAYLLMAGSANHMQTRFENGIVTVIYQDGGTDVLSLVNPETWAPIERDYYTDDFSYRMNQPRPYRVVLKTGWVARQFEDVINSKGLDRRFLDGGAALILDLPLDHSRELKKLVLKTIANEVVIGLMAVTLDRN